MHTPKRCEISKNMGGFGYASEAKGVASLKKETRFEEHALYVSVSSEIVLEIGFSQIYSTGMGWDGMGAWRTMKKVEWPITTMTDSGRATKNCRNRPTRFLR